MKIYNKFVESKKEPQNKSDIWFDGSSWNMYKEGMWRAFTLPLDAAERVAKMLKEFKLFKIVPSLPQVGENNIIYLVENVNSVEGNSLIEYVYINNKWEEIGKFTPELKLDDYLKKEDSPFEKGDAENSAVLKGGDNQVISEGGVALGSNNIVGLKGWYYKALRINTSVKTIDVFLTKNQTIPILSKPSNIETDIDCNLINGDIISIVNDKKYDNKFVVVNTSFLSNGFIRIQAIDNLPFTTIEQEVILDPEDYSIYCLSKPDAGIADIGQGSFAAGYYNKATNGKSSALGFNNHAYGKFSFTEGRDNEAGYAAHAEGRENIASGEQSHAEGKRTIASGNCSHAEGRNTVSVGLNSHAEGEGTTVEGTTSLSVGAHGRSSHVEGIATTTGEYNEQTGIWSKGDAAHAEGNLTIASGNHSHAEGSNTVASGWQAHSEGHNTIAKGNRSHAEGSGTQAYNLGEHAQGSFNKSTESTDKSKATHFSIGIGTSDTNRKNAVEVKQNGDVYITGIGGFTGANSDSSKSVQEVINELVNKLNEITTND